MGEGSMLVGEAIARSCAQHQQGRGYYFCNVMRIKYYAKVTHYITLRILDNEIIYV
jgi:hypothetical protein